MLDAHPLSERLGRLPFYLHVPPDDLPCCDLGTASESRAQLDTKSYLALLSLICGFERMIATRFAPAARLRGGLHNESS